MFQKYLNMPDLIKSLYAATAIVLDSVLRVFFP